MNEKLIIIIRHVIFFGAFILLGIGIAERNKQLNNNVESCRQD